MMEHPLEKSLKEGIHHMKEKGTPAWGLDLLALCNGTHGSCVGTGDPLPEDQETLLLQYLELRLKTWTSSTSAFDAAVHNLLQVAILEILQAIRERKSLDFVRENYQRLLALEEEEAQEFLKSLR